jgi:transcriptional regulator with XRE-family HTH domain
MNQPIRRGIVTERIPQWTIGDRLRKIRLDQGQGQRQFALDLGVASGTYSQWETGANMPRDLVAIARRIELLTRVPAAWTLGLMDLECAIRDSNPEPADYWTHAGQRAAA